MKKKKRNNINFTTMQEFTAILKDNGVLSPSMFVKKNTFVIDDVIGFSRSDIGYYQLDGFKLDGEGILDKEKTEIYLGNGSSAQESIWAKPETDFSSPAQIINIFTRQAGGDGSYTPEDGLLRYIAIHIILND